ncbi:MAG: hypothetical protein CMJ19_16170 [Phycisphaeraceae bacterium]|nr:hypothetical protein [Phycisphaeraceae bacterium]
MKLSVHMALSLCLLFAACTHAQTLEQLSQEVTALQQWRTQLANTGVDTSYEQVTLQTVSLFADYIAYDRAHPDELADIYQRYHKQIPDTPQAMAAALPDQELADCWQLLVQCRQSLGVLAAGTVNRRTVPRWDGRQITIGDGHFVQDNRPVFPGTLIWMPYTDANHQAFGSFKGAYTTLKYLAPDMTGTRASGTVLDMKSFPPEDTQFPSGLFLGHVPADWMKQQYPQIQIGARLFTKYDIDSPLIRDWTDVLLGKAVPESLPTNPIHLYLLANEPHWASVQGGWLSSEASEHTHAKFRIWLSMHYADIAALNASWQSAFASFDTVTIDIPIDGQLRGNAQWYDWCRFNMDRVTEWFTFLKSNIRQHDSTAQCTIKMLGGHMEDASRDHGLDIEQLVNLQDFPGLDAHPSPANAVFHDPVKAARRAHPYALDWRSQTNMLDMIKSIAPDKPVYDSEWHGMGTVGWISNAMSDDFIRAAMWMSFLHGNSAINTWYWARKADGKPMPALLASPMAQPIALNAYGKTLHELNAYAPEIVKLASTPKNVRIFYTEESAIQDADYGDDLITIHEAMTLTGANVGYLTPKIILDHTATCQMLVVPNAKYISDESLNALASFTGNVIYIGHDHFQFDPRGNARTGTLPVTIDPAKRFGLRETEMMTWTLRSQFGSAGVLPEIVAINRATGALPMGVLIRVAAIDNGQYIMSLVNTSVDEQDIVLKRNGIRVDAENITGEEGTLFDGVLPSLEVRLVKVQTSQ